MRRCPVTTTRRQRKRTGSRESGVTLHTSSHLMYSLPNVPSGSVFSLCRSSVFELMRGRSLRILRPSAESSIVSRNLGSVEPAVVSPRAATMSRAHQQWRKYSNLLWGGLPPRLGSINAMRAEPTVRNAFSKVLRLT